MTGFGEQYRALGVRYAKAWSSHSPDAVADFYAADGQIQINKGDVLRGRHAIAQMASSFYADFPDLIVRCDDVRIAGSHVLFAWTLEGHHVRTKNFVKVGGWEEWELDEDLRVMTSQGWFDTAEYQRQIAEG